MDLAAQAQQLSGRKFGELVLHHCKARGLQETVAALHGTIEEFPAEVKPRLESWIDEINPAGTSAEFWRSDCGDVFSNICLRGRAKLSSVIPDPTVDQIFSMFQIIVLNFAYAAHGNAKSMPSSRSQSIRASSVVYLGSHG